MDSNIEIQLECAENSLGDVKFMIANYRSLSVMEAEVARVKNHVDNAFKAHVQNLNKRGLTWKDIGEELGISRQAAQQRLGAVDLGGLSI